MFHRAILTRKRLGTGFFTAGMLGFVLSAVAMAAETTANPPWIDAIFNKPDADGFQHNFPVEWDWLRQDCGLDNARQIANGNPLMLGRDVLQHVLDEMPNTSTKLRSTFNSMVQQNLSDRDARWLMLYANACEARRAIRLARIIANTPQIAFIKRHSIRPSFFGYTEGQSDAQAERHFIPGAALCVLTLDGTRGHVEEWIADTKGVLRDPAVSWDGKQLAFAWKKSLNEDDYHLYQLDLASRQSRQLTSGLGLADYEPAYLPNGDFIFASTRCVQTVDCFWTEVSNLYTCDPQGDHIRRLGFDQVHTLYPQVLDDGRVIYTRWDYNDRGQIFPQPLFQMNPDGTNQTEFYGNNSWFPTTIAHARGIPQTSKVLAILCGHHSSQAGKLAIIDPSLGRQENQGVQLVSPIRETRAERIDGYGQNGELFCYPYPLDNREWLVSYAPDGWNANDRRRGNGAFGIYWMDIDGHRELLASDDSLPCLQAVPLAARPRPPTRASTVDFRKESGTYYVQDIYQGPGLTGIEKGTIKKLRVVSLEFRPAGIRSNGNAGPAGGAMVSTPISIGNGAWDVKRVLGETPVHADGSAFFVVPARMPVYFQAIDARGRTVQTMRSWSTLQAGENASCVGCHESKNSAPPAQGYSSTLAMKHPPLALVPFYGPARGFSFTNEIQPILDRQCISCHRDREPIIALARGDDQPLLTQTNLTQTKTRNLAFSLLGNKVADNNAGREWSDSYLALTQSKRENKNGPFRGDPNGPMVRWISSQSVPSILPPESAGATKSELLNLLDNGHYDVRLSREEYDKLACWIDLSAPFCGDYTEANIWNANEMKKFLHYDAKRKQMDALDRDVTKHLRDGQ